MCLIIAQERGSKTLDDSALREAWQQNPHGAGYMFAFDDEIIIRKPFWKLKELLQAYHADHKQFGRFSPFVIHFRWATHGKQCKVNTHPHRLDNGRVALVHNGILPFDPPTQSNISDTVYFCRTVLAQRPPEQLVSPAFAAILKDMIGCNKLVLLDDAGTMSIVNESLGHWDGSDWFSNYSYRPSSSVAWWTIKDGGLVDYDDEELGEIVRKHKSETPWDELSEADWQERFLEHEMNRAIAKDD
jgi:hypothetical protein